MHTLINILLFGGFFWWGGGFFLGLGSLTPFFWAQIFNFNFLGKPLLEEKYVEGKKKKKEERKNNAKFSGHYVYPRTETVRAHALRSHQ